MGLYGRQDTLGKGGIFKGNTFARLADGRVSLTKEGYKLVESHASSGATRVYQVIRSRRITRLHLKRSDFESQIIAILSSEQRPLGRSEIITELYERMHVSFSEADKETIKSDMARWEKTARWAVTDLKNKGFLQSSGRNQWSITAKGREASLMTIVTQTATATE